MASSQSLQTRSQRMVYLITYSRADLNRFDSRESFASAVLDTWGSVTTTRIVLYVVAREQHKTVSDNGNEYHYHMAIKLDKKCRWLIVRNALERRFGIQVNFSDTHPNYYSAYRYCIKEDEECVTSQDHPNLQEPPRTTAATSTRKSRTGQNKRSSSSKAKKKRQRLLSVYEVTQIIRR